MKKYNSIKEMEDDKQRQKDDWNEKCVEAMTDEELERIDGLIQEEKNFRKTTDALKEKLRN